MSKSTNQELTEKQVMAIPLLVAGKTARCVAKEIGVAPQTISEWRKEPKFEAKLNESKWNCLRESLDQLRSAASRAVSNLAEISEHAENEETRRKACMNILEMVGIADPTNGILGWRIGPEDPQTIVRKMVADEILAAQMDNKFPKHLLKK